MGTVAYLGDILLFGGTFAPKGWADCNGQLMDISQNQALFVILGTIYGGDGRTTFALPDLRGRVPVGVGSGGPAGFMARGQRSGTEVQYMDEQTMPSHFHATQTSANFEVKASTSVATDPSPTMDCALAAAKDSKKSQAIKLYRQANAGRVALGGALADAQVELSPTGGGQEIPNMQPWASTRYIIAIEGEFPPRN